MGRGDGYSKESETAARAFLLAAMGEGGDKGQAFPQSDAEDLSRGAAYIPHEITLARRRGDKVQFCTDCQFASCWYWQMPDGSRIYHYGGSELDRRFQEEHGGRCPECGNTNLKGETVPTTD